MIIFRMAPPQETLRKFGIKNKLVRNLVAEFFGTFMLLVCLAVFLMTLMFSLQFIGTSIVSQFHLGEGKTTQWIGLNIGWGLAITFSVLATLNLSGKVNRE